MRTLAYGPAALLVELEDPGQVPSLHAFVRAGVSSGALVAEDVVPGARTVLITGVSDRERVRRVLESWLPATVLADDARSVTIDVRYDGADLADVADRTGLGVRGVVQEHTGAEHRVAFCGFQPGFAYLTGLPEALHLPRWGTPRIRVPAGSVAVAGGYSGVYPREGPGGWHLLGTTRAVLWDLDRDPAALLEPGTRVRFREVLG